MSIDTHKDLLKFCSGGLAGMLAKTSIAPIDRLKFLFMGSMQEFTFPNMSQEFNRILREEGIRSLWKGNLAQIIRVFPYSGVVKAIQQFSIYGRSERMLKALNNNNSNTVVKFLSGSLAGSAALTMTYPFDVIRTRLAYQTTRKLYDGLFHGFNSIWAQEGLSSMFRGITPALIGASLYGGVTFTIFFTLKSSFPSASNSAIFVFGSAAGIVGQIISYPFDVVRKKMLAHGFLDQVSSFKSTSNSHQVNSMLCYFSMIWEVEGLRGLLKGLSLNFVKAPIMLGTVHLANHMIHEKLGEEY